MFTTMITNGPSRIPVFLGRVNRCVSNFHVSFNGFNFGQHKYPRISVTFIAVISECGGCLPLFNPLKAPFAGALNLQVKLENTMKKKEQLHI